MDMEVERLVAVRKHVIMTYRTKACSPTGASDILGRRDAGLFLGRH